MKTLNDKFKHNNRVVFDFYLSLFGECGFHSVESVCFGELTWGCSQCNHRTNRKNRRDQKKHGTLKKLIDFLC